MLNKPNSWKDAIPLAKRVYATHCAGCCLHIVLDDGNIDGDHVDYCIECAQNHGHSDCLLLAQMLRLMSRTQRFKLYKNHDEYAC